MKKCKNQLLRQIINLRSGTLRDGLARLRFALNRRQGFGLNEVIGIAAGIIIAVVVVIPGLRSFAGSILNNLTDWWNNMAQSIFATS